MHEYLTGYKDLGIIVNDESTFSKQALYALQIKLIKYKLGYIDINVQYSSKEHIIKLYNEV